MNVFSNGAVLAKHPVLLDVYARADRLARTHSLFEMLTPLGASPCAGGSEENIFVCADAH